MNDCWSNPIQPNRKLWWAYGEDCNGCGGESHYGSKIHDIIKLEYSYYKFSMSDTTFSTHKNSEIREYLNTHIEDINQFPTTIHDKTLTFIPIDITTDLLTYVSPIKI